ncbi:hypothetical protein ACPA9J_34560 [Pseudomonas aeruginosa]
MSGVIGSLELMQTVPMDVELAEYQRTAAGSARDMMRMVNDILALIRTAGRQALPAPRACSACAACSTACARSTRRAPRRGPALRPATGRQPAGHPQRRCQQAGPGAGLPGSTTRSSSPGGSVTLRVAAGRTHDGVALRVEVIDTGIGFDMRRRQRPLPAFRPGRQLVDPWLRRPRHRPGSVPAGGAAWRRADPRVPAGTGGRFLLRLQLTQPAQGLAPPPRRAGGQAVRRPEECTVLVVEDNAINQLVTRGMLLQARLPGAHRRQR